MELLFKALVLGIVEGLTEFLPISSTGHLIIASNFLNYPEEHRGTFEIFIQLGAILAVFWHYQRDLHSLLMRVRFEREARGIIFAVVVAFLPAAIVGLLFHDLIEEYLFAVSTVAGALVVGGVVLLAVERTERSGEIRNLEAIDLKVALWIGIAQVASLFPGVSRAGATIIGGLLVGLSRPVATQFSFYLALPTITAASFFSLAKSFSSLQISDAPPLAVGLVSAFVSALLVIRVFIRYVERHNFVPFGYYRITAGTLLFILAAGGCTG